MGSDAASQEVASLPVVAPSKSPAEDKVVDLMAALAASVKEARAAADRETGKIRAPFTPEQATALNAWQGRSDVHPFTCPADGSQGSERHSDRRILVATTERWECERCAYVQHWAHDFMAEGPRAERGVE